MQYEVDCAEKQAHSAALLEAKTKEANRKILDFNQKEKLHLSNVTHEAHRFNLAYRSNLLPTFDFKTKIRYKPY
jgi:hypothetical protein